jgi:dienelactone hydrolase
MLAGCAQPPTASVSSAPKGSVQGSAVVHTSESLRAAVQNAWVTLPAVVTGGVPYAGLLKSAPVTQDKAPVVVFVHGSSGVAPAIKEWMLWVATSQGVAVVAADSMQLPDRITYKSPIAKADYEKVHGLRTAELNAALTALPQQPWADVQRVVLAGTSEGAVAVARHVPQAGMLQEKGRMVFSWTCENNYHVQDHRTHLPDTLPVLNIVSSTDVYFSRSNSWLGNDQAVGHCGAALAGNKVSSVVLIPNAPHTLFNLPQARGPVVGFLQQQLGGAGKL